MRIAALFSAVIIFLLTRIALAQDHPTLGFVYNTTESDALQYDCTMDRGDLHCSFIQVRTRPKLGAEEAQKRLEKELSEFGTSADSVPDKKTCERISGLAAALQNGAVPDGVDRDEYLSEMSKIGAEAKARTLHMFELFSAFCADKNKRNYAELLRYMIERDERTCVISAHPYTQRFRYFPQTGTWVVRQDGPEGACGIVNVSRFEPEKGVSDFTFWNYHAQKIVTNKGGQSFLPCSDYDEASYKYQWQSRSIPMTCETIEFGPL